MRLRLRWLGLCAVAMALLPRSAAGISFFDGRVEVHGFYETQVRSLVRDFDPSDGWDLSQWWHILNVEIDAEIAPDGVGPFDLITMFARLEVRYDCVWTRACTMFDSANLYNIHRTERGGPGRLLDGTRTGFTSNNYTGDRRRYYDLTYEESGDQPEGPYRPDGTRKTMRFWQTSLGGGFFRSTGWGVDAQPGIQGDALEPAPGADDPPLFIFRDLLRPNCQAWGVRSRPGPEDGRSSGETLLLDPSCEFEQIGAAAFFPNVYREGDFQPLIGQGGSGSLPFRQAPETANTNSNAAKWVPRGLYYPNARLQEMLEKDEFANFSPVLRRNEVAWNRGQSQQDQKELKELYFDIEMFDSQLWIRAGYQTIVWGKTELFRNQDQLNPQDFALSSLPSLEESRIALWALRATWSFYEVGPLQDVRAEIAVNYDEYQPNDFGTCGEPYTVLLACGFSTGAIANGYLGIGLAGAVLPPDAWNSWKGIEVGGRLEWRWERFSFAVTDFYGFQDIPWVSREFTYSRNVDPLTGRPRRTEESGRCKSGGERACLNGDESLLEHHGNQQIFAVICADTLAVAPALDPTACLANIFGSQNRTQPEGEIGPRLNVAINTITSGDSAGAEGVIVPGLFGFPEDGRVQDAIEANTWNRVRKVTILLNRDANDGPIDYTTTTESGNALLASSDFATTVDFFYGTLGGSLSDKLTDQQEALLGCGAFYETSCDLDGIDFFNAEAGVVFQSFSNIQGTRNFPGDRWDTTDASRAQPGTVGFFGEPLCSRVEGGKTFMLPGCRGPGDPGYDPNVDGTVDGLLHPFTGQQFKNELAAWSWNFFMALVGFSMPDDNGRIDIDEFDADDPFRKDGCSFAAPQWCGNVGPIVRLAGNQRASIKAGGNGSFGRRDFLWHSGSMLAARVQKLNILGFSMDFAEDLTKSNWGVEFTWVNDIFAGDADQYDGVTEVDLYRLTISVDRPTFVNFLNANRTFFFNTQWFVQYTDGHRKNFFDAGPWDIFGVMAVSTGYFQDRLLPSAVFVYFVRGGSLAFLPQITYRFTESFTATVGIAAFAGSDEARTMSINPPAPASQRFGRHQNDTFVQNGLSVIRERDELFLRIRYTF